MGSLSQTVAPGRLKNDNFGLQSGGVSSVSNEQLWAPWRIGYILGDKNLPQTQNVADLLPDADPGCFLCQCVPQADDRARLVVDRGPHAMTVLNRYPYNNGHLLIAPKQHVGRLDALDDAVQVELSLTITRMIKALDKIIQPHGYNVGLNLGQAAGAGVPGHLHWHIVPRWSGDTNFMSSVAGIRTIPQSLEALWDILTEELRKK
jgi:ATP adenylyltransferase